MDKAKKGLCKHTICELCDLTDKPCVGYEICEDYEESEK